MVLRIEGARICRTRDVLGSIGIVENGSSSCCVGERNSRREERISRYGWIVSGVLVFSWIDK
jgi:hypothetical protein